MATLEASLEIILNIMYGVLIFTIGLIIGKLLGKSTTKVLNDREIIKKLEAEIKIPIDSIVGEIVAYSIYLLGLIIALNKLGIGAAILSVISGAALLLIILLIILGIKDVVPNAMAGIIVHAKNLIQENDNVVINNIEGKVIQSSLIETKIETEKGDVVIIPNSQLLKHEIIKHKKK
jgi:small conductance mechanosensitive channel